MTTACRRMTVLALCGSLLSCAVTETTQSDAALEKRQYMCASTIHVSDMSRGFLLPVDEDRSRGDVQAGKILDRMVQQTFWKDSTAAASGRALPALTIGFDGGTGVRTGNGKYVAQISLQFQVFKPTGQSYMDIVVGQSSVSGSGQAAGEKAVEAAMQQALHRLGNILANAEICRQIQ